MPFTSWNQTLKSIEYYGQAFPTLNCVSLLIYSISACLSICFHSCWCLVVICCQRGCTTQQFQTSSSIQEETCDNFSPSNLGTEGDKLPEVKSRCMNFVLSFDHCTKIEVELYVPCFWCTSVCTAGLQREVSSPTPQDLLQTQCAEKNFQYILLKPIL